MNTHAAPLSRSKPLWHHLYFWVLVGIGIGILIGLLAPTTGAKMKWMADLFIKLVKMVIAPTIFATVAVGIASIGNLAKAGGLALRTDHHCICASYWFGAGERIASGGRVKSGFSQF